MKFKVLVVGAGQLGSRYLQGLSKVSMPLEIWVSDVSAESLARAEERWREVNGQSTSHQVRYIIGLAELPGEIDLAIVATSADVRAVVVTQLVERISVRYWVLEKVLAQNDAGLVEIQSAIGSRGIAWVNTPRRLMDWHKKIKAELVGTGPLSMTVEGGGWGLACNAVHFLDLLAWWGDCELLAIDTAALAPIWMPSKRVGFWEVFGTLNANFSNHTNAQLVCSAELSPKIIKIESGDQVWTIDEAAGIAKSSEGLEISGKMIFQSDITALVAESILLKGQCDLPSLHESVSLHRPFLQGLMAHWNQHMPTSVTCLPIT